MPDGHSDGSREGDPTGWRRFYEFWTTLPGVLTGIAAVLGAITALAAATHLFDPAPHGGPSTLTESGKPPGPACSDGVDNDGDGRTDFPRDPDCSSRTDPSEKKAACSDGRDNDGDGKTDAQDSNCSSPTDPSEKNPPCSDGIDNDGDGNTDFPEDPECSSRTDPAEKQ
jgi:hypothetical protein